MRYDALGTAWAPRLLSVLRIVAGLTYFAHGTQKLIGFPASENGAPAIYSLGWISGALEIVLGFLIIIGLLTRPAAFIASGHMAFAYWIAHAPQSPFPSINGGDAAILFCFTFLYIAAAGPGPWSVDAGRRRAA